ncbi:hypothetical protein GCM10010466_62750 [Planomonospora alba]|uniref:Uncharacterized protein n=1 Tax=Planomonospora alba TaxID=161354 RepID=A0ABP6NZU6_9ACTN
MRIRHLAAAAVTAAALAAVPAGTAGAESAGPSAPAGPSGAEVPGPVHVGDCAGGEARRLTGTERKRLEAELEEAGSRVGKAVPGVDRVPAVPAVPADPSADGPPEAAFMGGDGKVRVVEKDGKVRVVDGSGKAVPGVPGRGAGVRVKRLPDGTVVAEAVPAEAVPAEAVPALPARPGEPGGEPAMRARPGQDAGKRGVICIRKAPEKD